MKPAREDAHAGAARQQANVLKALSRPETARHLRDEVKEGAVKKLYDTAGLRHNAGLRLQGKTEKPLSQPSPRLHTSGSHWPLPGLFPLRSHQAALSPP